MSSSDESPDEQADGGEIVIDGKTPLNSSAATSPLSTVRSLRGWECLLFSFTTQMIEKLSGSHWTTRDL